VEHRLLNPDDPEYAERIKRHIAAPPTLSVAGPLAFLARFNMAVVASDSIPARAVLAANDVLFSVREFAMNYVGGWHSVFETEVFRLALDRKTDPNGQRTLTAVTARGLTHETPDGFLADRFGREGPFTDFPQKPEFFRRIQAGEVLWLSATDAFEPGMPPAAVILRNQVACALADVVFVPYAARESRTHLVGRWLMERGIPAFTTEAEDSALLWELGVQKVGRKTVRPFLEKLGARLISRGGGTGNDPPVGELDVPDLPPAEQRLGQQSGRRPKRSTNAGPMLFPRTQER